MNMHKEGLIIFTPHISCLFGKRSFASTLNDGLFTDAALYFLSSTLSLQSI